jgi:cytochrome c biogenesis protein CcmG, thiol:disulfide interchange protein DsbE
MTVKQQWSIVALFVLLMGSGLFAATRIFGDELFPVSVGSRAPAFHAVTLDTPSTVKTLEDYKGRVVLLNIWATWCAPCRVEMPSIEKLHQALGPAGLEVVALSVDGPGQDDVIRDFAKRLGLTFTILHDPSDKTQKQYQATAVPETFIIGRDGVIRKKLIGAVDWNSASNRAVIEQLLGEPGS